jgi:aquaporin Z
MKKFIAELIGTFTLVLFGCGTAVIAGGEVGFVGISFAFGIAIIGMAYGIGPISGCHVNPAVSIGVLVSGRMSVKDFVTYIIAQFIGGILAVLIIYLLTMELVNKGDLPMGQFGQNGYGSLSPTGYGLLPAIIFELVATFIFVTVILGSTQKEAPSQFAGLSIGLTLTGIHLLGIPITGVSVNPARSLAPAIFAGGTALTQVWLFLLIPSLAGLLAGILFKLKVLEKQE